MLARGKKEGEIGREIKEGKGEREISEKRKNWRERKHAREKLT